MVPEPIWIGSGGLLGGGVVPATSGAAAEVGTIRHAPVMRDQPKSL